VDKAHPSAQAVALLGDGIVAVGSAAGFVTQTSSRQWWEEKFVFGRTH
jgi:predicted amidohydrolase YtcJ